MNRIKALLLFVSSSSGLPVAGQVNDVDIRAAKELVTKLDVALDKRDLMGARATLAELDKVLRIRTPGMRERLEQFEAGVAGNPVARRFAARRLAMMAEEADDIERARLYALEALDYAGKGFESAQNVFYANQVMGLLALRDNDAGLAARMLLASLDRGGWDHFSRVGPNMRLARRLIGVGKSGDVIEFLERCKKLWMTGARTLANWQAILRDGGIPDLTSHELAMP